MNQLERYLQFLLGIRISVPVKEFQIGERTGGERLKGLFGLDEVPKGDVEIVIRHEKGQTVGQIDLDLLRKKG